MSVSDWSERSLESVAPLGTVEGRLENLEGELRQMELGTFQGDEKDSRRVLESILAEALRVSLIGHLRMISQGPDLLREVQSKQAQLLYSRAEAQLLGRKVDQPEIESPYSYREFRKAFSITLSSGEKLGMSQGIERLSTSSVPREERIEIASLFSEYAAARETELAGALSSALTSARQYRDALRRKDSVSFADRYDEGSDTLCEELSAETVKHPSISSYLALIKGAEALPWPDLFLRPDRATQKVRWEEVYESVVEAFSEFDSACSAIVQRLFSEGRVRTKARSNEPSFCATYYVPNDLPFVNAEFHGTVMDGHLLSHELGHAVHGACLKDLRFLERGTPKLVAESIANFFSYVWADYVLRTGAISHPNLKPAILEPHVNSLVRRAIIGQFEAELDENVSGPGMGGFDAGKHWFTCYRDRLRGVAEIPDTIKPWWGLSAWVMNFPLQQSMYVASEVIAGAMFSKYLSDRDSFLKRFLPLLQVGALSAEELLIGVGLRSDPNDLVMRAEATLNCLWRN